MVMMRLVKGWMRLPVQRAMVSARASSQRGRIADHAAVGPFEMGVARRQVGLAEDDDAPFEAALGGDRAERRVGLLHQRLVDAHHEVEARRLIGGGSISRAASSNGAQR